MTKAVNIGFELIEAIPEIQLIHLLIMASEEFDTSLTKQEKHRAIEYFYRYCKEASEKSEKIDE